MLKNSWEWRCGLILQAWDVETAVSLLASQSSPFHVFQVSEKPWAIKTGEWFLRSNTWGCPLTITCLHTCAHTHPHTPIK